jgi:ATP-binding cassette subfamily B protein
VALLLFLGALLGLERLTASGLLRIGRRLELRLRMAFLRKIPRLEDAYLHSRLKSDMAERAHNIHLLRLLPRTAGTVIQTAATLLLTAAGIAWLDPGAAGLAALAAAAALAVPLLAQRPLLERDLRLRTHAGALCRFYLDALLGLMPIRAHGAQRAMRSQHDALLRDWADAGVAVERSGVWADAVQALVGGGFAVWIFFDHVSRVGESGGVLLLLYWSLALPLLGQELAALARQYPAQRNVALRLLEPLQAPEAERVASPDAVASGAVALRFEGVSVRAAGHTILRDIDLQIAAGEHVAVVGPSGAGKSTLVGLLLGWHRPARGRLLVDDAVLDPGALERLRRGTAWIDPAVQLWNRSVLENLCYGAAGAPVERAGDAIDVAQLRELLERLPDGLQTRMGEGGGLVSGGEGQRVRFARALLRGPVRLVVMDEPFRGLGRPERRRLLAEARRRWAGSTLVCITHEIGETADFARVVVVENGRVVESGSPSELAAGDSRYRRLLEAERVADESIWGDPSWRRLSLEGGRVVETSTRGEW